MATFVLVHPSLVRRLVLEKGRSAAARTGTRCMASRPAKPSAEHVSFASRVRSSRRMSSVKWAPFKDATRSSSIARRSGSAPAIRSCRQRAGNTSAAISWSDRTGARKCRPERLRIGRAGARQQHLARRPALPEQRPQGVDRAGDGAVADLVRTLGLRLIDRVAEDGNATSHGKRRHRDTVLHAQPRDQAARGTPKRKSPGLPAGALSTVLTGVSRKHRRRRRPSYRLRSCATDMGRS